MCLLYAAKQQLSSRVAIGAKLYLQDLGPGPLSSKEHNKDCLLLLFTSGGVKDAAHRGGLQEHVSPGCSEQQPLKGNQLLLLNHSSHKAKPDCLGVNCLLSSKQWGLHCA